MIGSTAGYNIGSAEESIMIGQSAGNGSGGDGNIALGFVANGGDGDYNIALGYRAGNSSMTGTNNVLIGYYAGNTFTIESNKLIITSGSSPLITGDFANNTLDISGSVTIVTGSLTLDYDSLPTSDPNIKGAIYRSSSAGIDNLLFISPGS